MGLCPSTTRKIKREDDLPAQRLPQEPQDDHPISKYDDEIIKVLKHTMTNDPELFVLDQIILSVFFFDNFEK